MTLKGAVPPDFNTPTGRFRLLANDVVFANESGGFGEYELFSDEEISGFLAIAPESILRCVGFGYLSLAGSAAVESKIVKDFDLQADLTDRAADLRSTARAYFERADIEAERIGVDSEFGVESEQPQRHWIEPTQRDVLGWGNW